MSGKAIGNVLVDKLTFWGITTIITGGMAWMTFITMSVMAIPNEDKIRVMVQNDNPYTRDQKAIAQQLEGMSKAIDRNTDAINRLKEELYRKNN